MTLERRIDISGGYNLIRKEPGKNYGVGACGIWFYVMGEKGAVQFKLGTNWYPQSARDHLAKFPASEYDKIQPKAWDLGYHAKEPQYVGHNECDCTLFPEGKCFYDGSTLNAEKWLEGFLNGGTEWLWPRLEQYYRCRFEGEDYPDITPIPRKHPDENGRI